VDIYSTSWATINGNRQLFDVLLRKLVTPDLQKYYEDRFSMMGSDGWKDLVEDIDTIIESPAHAG
jgi:hypothetical protein